MYDLRSDTVTKPCTGMRRAMTSAKVGDDVYMEDPTVNRLEAMVSSILSKEDAVFSPSGTQSNLIAMMTHCTRGDEYIVGEGAHTFKYEGGGAWIRVGKENRTWEREGSVLIFDDSFEHEVHHNGVHRRIVLIMDFWHPELVISERVYQ